MPKFVVKNRFLKWVTARRYRSGLGILAIAVAVAGTIFAVEYVTGPLQVQASADAVLQQYMHSRSDVSSYTISDRLWTHFCCANSLKAKPEDANSVRYTVSVKLTAGTTETETIDLSDSRDEAEQMYYSGMPGARQHWKFVEVYRPGETPRPAIWSI